MDEAEKETERQKVMDNMQIFWRKKENGKNSSVQKRSIVEARLDMQHEWTDIM